MNGIKKDIELNKLIEEHFEKQLQQTNYWLSFAEAKNPVFDSYITQQ